MPPPLALPPPPPIAKAAAEEDDEDDDDGEGRAEMTRPNEAVAEDEGKEDVVARLRFEKEPDLIIAADG